MIKESDIKVGNVLKYLGGHVDYDLDFTTGDLYTVETFGEHLHIKDNGRYKRSGWIFELLAVWELVSTTSIEESSTSSNEISLTLTQDEAQVLADVLSCIGGDPRYSRRKFTKSVADKLEHFGITYKNRYEYEEASFDMGGTINFTKSVKATVEYNGSTYDKVEFDSMLEKLEKL